MTTTVAPPQPPAVTMMQMIVGALWINKAIYVAAKLGIADLLVHSPRDSEDVARAAGAHPPSLHRVLRALASVGVFAEDDAGRFQLTPLSETLRTDAPGSLNAMAVLWGEPWHWDVWGSFLHGVQTGETAWQHATGDPLFTYFGKHPDHAQQFDAAMSSFSGQEADAVAKAYDFSTVHTLLDVGGGQGLLLATILRKYPHLRGVVFDLPHLDTSATGLLANAGLGDRAYFTAGDFFTSIPRGADVCILKNIVHDFTDEQVVQILTNCRQALPPDGKVLVVQEALPTGNTPSFGKLLDLQMLLIGGRERTEADYRALYASAGFDLARVVPTQSPLHVIEGVARSD